MKTQSRNWMMLGGLGSVVLTLALMPTMSWADDPDPLPPPEAPITVMVADCQESAIALNGVYLGTAFVTLNDVPFAVSSVSKQLALEQRNDGMVLRTMARVLEFGFLTTLTIVSEEILIPIGDGWYNLSATVRMAGGTGMFEIAHGQATAAGLIHADGPSVQATWNLRGAFYFF
jgi:hypothetical protein